MKLTKGKTAVIKSKTIGKPLIDTSLEVGDTVVVYGYDKDHGTYIIMDKQGKFWSFLESDLEPNL